MQESQKRVNKENQNKELVENSMPITKRDQIQIGTSVQVVQKQDQRSGKLTQGIVSRILTNSHNHPRGIKVMLEGGIVGRVMVIDSISNK